MASTDPSPADFSGKSMTGAGGTTVGIGTERSRSRSNSSGSGSGSRSGKEEEEAKPQSPQSPQPANERHRKMVEAITAEPYGVKGNYYPFDYHDVITTLNEVKEIFDKEPPLIEMAVPVVVVGDVHGQFFDVCRIFKMFEKNGKSTHGKTRYVFLGDYVDRGKQSLEIIITLFHLKILHPNHFALLRGNHECRAINRAYGFFAEIRERFKDQKKSTEMFELFNSVFSYMPLACLVANGILCMHGGISSKMKTRDDFKKIKKPIKDVAACPIATDLLWADPMVGLASSDISNKVRGVSVYFGEATMDTVMKDLGLHLIIRGHQMMMNGFNFFHNKLITVFSAAAYYPDKPNRGAVCIIGTDGRVKFRQLLPEKDGPNKQEKMFRGEIDLTTELDTGYYKKATEKVPKDGSKRGSKKRSKSGSKSDSKSDSKEGSKSESKEGSKKSKKSVEESSGGSSSGEQTPTTPPTATASKTEKSKS